MTVLKIIFLIFLSTGSLLEAKICIACVGDSITYGAAVKNRKENSFPAKLASLLGDAYEVGNFGVNGATMLQGGDKPYMKTAAYRKALEFEPNIVIIKLGTNDSKPKNWAKKDNFTKSADALIKSFQQLKTKPRVILCMPAPVIGAGRWGITEKVVRNEVAKQISKIAFASKLELIDLHLPLCDKPEFIPDRVHPNAQGAERIATHLHQYIIQPRDTEFNLKIAGAPTSFHGFPQITVNKQCKIVTPYLAAKGRPWIWRARFWGHQPQFDIQMLELGFHIVYCNVGNLFGAPSAVIRWDDCYKRTQMLDLNPKSVLEGMSRGGLIIHNWAVANPKKVAGIIGDNCVMDFKSWPAGFGSGKGAMSAWKSCKNAFGFKSDEEAKEYSQNPIDTIKAIQKAMIPVLYLIGNADKVVPPAENSALAAEKLKDYKFLTVINKPGKKHHPHSLPNPLLITKFALKCYGFLGTSKIKE